MPAPKWEYQSFGTNNFDDPKLNELGREGWECVGFAPTEVVVAMMQPRKLMVFVFKRQVADA